MSVGIAFSGGGVTAAIGAFCAWNALVDTYPFLDSINSPDLTISTVSGGSIGYGLWVNARQKINFVKYQENAALQYLLEGNALVSSPNNIDTFENFLKDGYNLLFRDNGLVDIDDYNSSHRQASKTGSTKKQGLCESKNNDTKISVGEIASEIFSSSFMKDFFSRRNDSSNGKWWTSAVRRIFDIVCVGDIQGGEISWISSFGYFNQTRMFETNEEQGTLLPSSAKMLHHVHVNMTTGGVFAVSQDVKSRQWKKSFPMSTLDSLSYSSAFWASAILSRPIPYALFKNLLLRTNHSLFENEADSINANSVYIVDGGVIDTTGIVGLLQLKKDHIIAFYNNNMPLNKMESSIAYLFGVNVPTDAMNSLKGPILSQVFSSELYLDVITNLTDPRIGIARLNDIRILPNQMGVDPYLLSSLVLFSNGENEKFGIHHDLSKLSNHWPDQFSFDVPILDANFLCIYNDWKVKQNKFMFDNILLMARNQSTAKVK